MARHPTSIGGFHKLWERHEKLYHSIFFDALNLLKISDKQRKNEDDISEALCPVLRRVCFGHPAKPSIPKWELPIAPTTDNELIGGKNRKRPDFTCSLINSFAQSDDMYEISLQIECKRLGEKKGSWDLNKNYVQNGIRRFDSLTHEYGKRAPSGIMIGYIIDSKRIDILSVVNMHIKTIQIENLKFDFTVPVTSYNSIFNRKVVEPKSFRIVHLWADFRKSE